MGNSSSKKSTQNKDNDTSIASSTKLYALIDAKEWSSAIQRIMKKPEEARVWSTIRMYGSDRNVLPLHRACTLDPPVALINALIECYPLSVQVTTKTCGADGEVQHRSASEAQEDWLPLQIAVHFKATPSVLEALLIHFPMAAYYRNRAGRLPIHTTCKRDLNENSQNGNKKSVSKLSEIVDLLLRAFPESVRVKSDTGLTPLDYVMSANPVGSSINADVIEEREKIVQALQKSGHYEMYPLPPPRQPIVNKALQKQTKKESIAPKPTKLFEYIVAKDWEKALNRCQKQPIEASIWVKYKGKDGIPWLPLHVAFDVKAPFDLIEVLCDAFPEGVTSKENLYGMLPIHICVQRKNSEDSLKRLISIHPACIWTKDSFDLLPLHVACTDGCSLNTIETLLMHAPESRHVRGGKKEFTPKEFAQKGMHPSRAVAIDALEKDSKHWKTRLLQSTFIDNGQVNSNGALYELITACDWDAANKRSRSNPIEAKLWTKDSDKFGRLPIHKCVALNPPLRLVQSLVEAYPEGLQAREKNDMLPLHVAIENNVPQDVLEYIIEEYPEGATMVDSFGRLPIAIACISGISETCLQMLLRAYPESAQIQDASGETPLSYIRQSDHDNKTLLIRILLRDPTSWALVESVTNNGGDQHSGGKKADSRVGATSVNPNSHGQAGLKGSPAVVSTKVEGPNMKNFSRQRRSFDKSPQSSDAKRAMKLSAERAGRESSSYETKRAVKISAELLKDDNEEEEILRCSGKRLGKLKAMRSSVHDDSDEEEPKPKPTHLARRKPVRGRPTPRPLPVVSNPENSHRNLSAGRHMWSADDDIPFTENQQKSGFSDSPSVEISELTNETQYARHLEESDDLCAKTQFLMSKWSVAESILNNP